jgi:hypothetical protein
VKNGYNYFLDANIKNKQSGLRDATSQNAFLLIVHWRIALENFSSELVNVTIYSMSDQNRKSHEIAAS